MFFKHSYWHNGFLIVPLEHLKGLHGIKYMHITNVLLEQEY